MYKKAILLKSINLVFYLIGQMQPLVTSFWFGEHGHLVKKVLEAE